MNEELGCDVEVGPLLDCRVYEVLPERQVVIITFGMIQRDERELRHSLEHRALRLVCLDELRGTRIAARLPPSSPSMGGDAWNLG